MQTTRLNSSYYVQRKPANLVQQTVLTFISLKHAIGKQTDSNSNSAFIMMFSKTWTVGHLSWCPRKFQLCVIIYHGAHKNFNYRSYIMVPTKTPTIDHISQCPQKRQLWVIIMVPTETSTVGHHLSRCPRELQLQIIYHSAHRNFNCGSSIMDPLKLQLWSLLSDLRTWEGSKNIIW